MPSGELMHPLWEAGNLRRALQPAGVSLWSWNVTSNRFTMDEQAFTMWDVPQSDTVTFEDLSSHIHPADVDRVRAAFTATRAVLGPIGASCTKARGRRVDREQASTRQSAYARLSNARAQLTALSYRTLSL